MGTDQVAENHRRRCQLSRDNTTLSNACARILSLFPSLSLCGFSPPHTSKQRLRTRTPRARHSLRETHTQRETHTLSLTLLQYYHLSTFFLSNVYRNTNHSTLSLSITLFLLCLVALILTATLIFVSIEERQRETERETGSRSVLARALPFVLYNRGDVWCTQSVGRVIYSLVYP